MWLVWACNWPVTSALRYLVLMGQGKLNPKQEAFVREYVVDFNATQAAVRAGYAPKNADVTAARLLVKASIQAALNVAKARVADRADVSAEEIINELRAIAFGKATDSASWSDGRMTLQNSADLTEDTIKTIASIEEEEREFPGGGSRRKVRIKHYDKLRALELLGRYRGLFVDKKEISGPSGKPIEVQQPSWLDIVAKATAEK